MNWDGNKTNDYFIGLHDRHNPDRYSNKPKYEAFDDLHDIELALKDLYSTCAQNAWTRARLITALDRIINSATASSKAKNSEKYLETKKDEALNIKTSIENNTLTF